jgi:hypothetical protein
MSNREKAMHRKAGRSTRDMETKRYLLRAGLVLIGLLIIWIYFQLIPSRPTWGTVPLLLGLIISLKVFDRWLHRKIDQVHKREKDAQRGAEAEEKVGEILDGLDKDRFQVFHDVVLGYGNMDHVVLRRDGAIFLIETKSHAGKITHDGHSLLQGGHPFEKDFIKQTLGNVLSLGKHLGGYAEREVWVNGILCFTRGFVEVRKRIKGIHVMNIKCLLRGLEEGKGDSDLADWLWEHLQTLLSLPPKDPTLSKPQGFLF